MYQLIVQYLNLSTSIPFPELVKFTTPDTCLLDSVPMQAPSQTIPPLSSTPHPTYKLHRCRCYGKSLLFGRLPFTPWSNFCKSPESHFMFKYFTIVKFYLHTNSFKSFHTMEYFSIQCFSFRGFPFCMSPFILCSPFLWESFHIKETDA